MRNEIEVPTDFISDGCTAPILLKRLFSPYAEACRWHDWARRHLVHYGIVTVQQADAELHAMVLEIAAAGMPRWARALRLDHAFARLTWLAVKLARPYFSATEPVPNKWATYLNSPKNGGA